MKLSTKPLAETYWEIEEAQVALRDSIDRARNLVEETARLILKHRIEAARPANPQS